MKKTKQINVKELDLRKIKDQALYNFKNKNVTKNDSEDFMIECWTTAVGRELLRLQLIDFELVFSDGKKI